MAKPDINDGHIDIANDLSEALMRINLSGYQYRIIWCVFRKTYGWHKSTDKISLTQFEKMTGIERRHINRTLKKLEALNMITIDRNNRVNTYKFNSNYDTWKTIDSTNIDTKVVPKEALKLVPKKEHTKEKKETIQKKLYKKKVKESKDKYLDFVLLTKKEYKKLTKELGVEKTKQMIDLLNCYLGSTGKKYASHYFTILNWIRKERSKLQKEPKEQSKRYRRYDEVFGDE